MCNLTTSQQDQVVDMISDLTTRRELFTAWQITYDMRSANPYDDIRHRDVKEYVHELFTSQDDVYEGYNRGLLEMPGKTTSAGDTVEALVYYPEAPVTVGTSNIQTSLVPSFSGVQAAVFTGPKTATKVVAPVKTPSRTCVPKHEIFELSKDFRLLIRRRFLEDINAKIKDTVYIFAGSGNKTFIITKEKPSVLNYHMYNVDIDRNIRVSTTVMANLFNQSRSNFTNRKYSVHVDGKRIVIVPQ